MKKILITLLSLFIVSLLYSHTTQNIHYVPPQTGIVNFDFQTVQNEGDQHRYTTVNISKVKNTFIFQDDTVLWFATDIYVFMDVFYLLQIEDYEDYIIYSFYSLSGDVLLMNESYDLIHIYPEIQTNRLVFSSNIDYLTKH